MCKRSMRMWFRLSLPAVLSLAVFALGRTQDSLPQATAQDSARGPAPLKSLSRMALPGTNELQLIIELTDPPAVQAMAALTRSGATAASVGGIRTRPDFGSPQALAYRAQLARAQRLVTDRLNAMSGVQVQDSTDVVLNAIIARVPMDRYLEIRRLPGVKKVYFSRLQRKFLDTSATLLNAPALWAQAGGRSNAGRGIKIGVIDTGIDITNPMFVDATTTLPAGFPKGETAFTNHKVIVARNYINLLSNPQRVRTAIDEDGHGTFVAGCAAGKLVTAPLAQISGMAPAAFLGSYKVFGQPGVNDFASTSAILAAINAAVADGMDVVNLSLGSLDYVPPSEDPEVTAIDNAVAAGVVVVLAGGNNGPDTHTISTPGSAPSAITVGAVSNSRVYGSQLHVTGPGPVPADLQNLVYRNGAGPVISTAIPSTPVTDVLSLDGNGLACSALPSDSLSGKMAFVERGECTFAVKVSNAKNAGAQTVLVYNNVAGEAPITMGGLESTTIPAVMISYSDGLLVKDFLSANDGVTISVDVSTNIVLTATVPDELTSFSSRGPSPDFGIKPDLVAVGENVYSATQINFVNQGLYDASQFTTASGTSFSTPMVSGAAAAVKGLFPGLDPAGIKSALANTAAQSVTTDGTTPATVVQAGNGLLDMGKAAVTGAIFTPTSINFGVQSYSGSIALSRTLAIANTSSNADQYTLSIRPLISGPSISLDITNTGSIAPGASANIAVSLQAVAPLSGGFQGFIAIQSARTGTVYTVPYWAGVYVPDFSRVLTVSKNPSSGNYRTVAAALADAQPGNIIEIADSESYLVGPDGITISTNAQGLPLHGITLRAAAGQTPELDGTVTNALADIQVIGVRNVLIQGITLRGGETGVDILQPAASVPTSVTVDHCNITDMNASSTSTGIFVENGGEVDVTYSTITGSSSSGVFVMGGGQLTMSRSAVQGNQSDGIDALDSNVDLLNSTISNNVGIGANLINCTGTVSKNTFAANKGNFGDGVDLLDGTVTVSDNIFNANDSAGIYLGSESSATLGPTAVIERNTVQSNVGFGVQSDQAKDLRLSGNMIKDNGVGFISRGSTAAVLVNNIIVRSTDALQGNGVDVGGTSSVRLVNDTIYGNRQRGITRSTSATVAAVNIIISSNTAGDLLGLSAGAIQFSLIGDGTLATSGNNIPGNPGLKSPSTDDFSLNAGSLAIDSGSNAAANLPFLDYNQQLRVAGNGFVDMGALEAGSSYPLVYPLMVNGFNSVIGDDYTTGIAVMNPSSSPQSAQFSAYRPDGNLITGSSNPTPLALSMDAQVATLGYQLFGLTRDAGDVGGVLATSMQRLTGFFLVFSQDFKRTADGVDVSADTATKFFFPRHQYDNNGKATYVLFNPGVNAATVTATLLDTSGTIVDQLSQPINLPPKGQSLFNFANFAASSGAVSISSDRPIAGLELFGNTAEIAALKAAIPGSEARLYFPHFVVNGGYTSILGVVNPAGSQANLTLTAYSNDGSVLGTPAQRSVGPKGQLFESATSLFGLSSGAIFTGYAVVQGDQPGITGFSQFIYDNGVVQSTAAVPGESIPKQKLIFSHVAHEVPASSGGDYQTGIALLNPYGTPVSYTMRVFDGSGSLVGQMTDTLGPHAKVAKVLSYPFAGPGFFTQPMALGNGHIEVTTDYELLGFELFYTDGWTQLVAVMAQFPN